LTGLVLGWFYKNDGKMGRIRQAINSFIKYLTSLLPGAFVQGASGAAFLEKDKLRRVHFF
jgi:hypothetical protein